MTLFMGADGEENKVMPLSETNKAETVPQVVFFALPDSEFAVLR
jgi:hypothetical protein